MKKILLTVFIAILMFPVFHASAQSFSDVSNMRKQTEAFQKTSGFESQTQEGLANIVAQVIKIFLSVLGIIFVVLIVLAGNKWMNAGGNEEKGNEAKDGIRRAIIGLIITVGAYSITYFIFSAISK